MTEQDIENVVISFILTNELSDYFDTNSICVEHKEIEDKSMRQRIDQEHEKVSAGYEVTIPITGYYNSRPVEKLSKIESYCDSPYKFTMFKPFPNRSVVTIRAKIRPNIVQS